MSQRAIRKSYYSTSALSTLVGRLGEFTVDITKTTLVVFDGTTAGGVPLARADHTHALATDFVAGFMSAGDHVFLYNHSHANATTLVPGFMSAADKSKLDGIPPGGGGGGGGAPQSSSAIPNTVVLRDVNADFSSHFITAVKFIGPLNGNADTATNGVVTTGSYADPAWITSLSGLKLTGTVHGTLLDTVNWTKMTGTAPNVSIFPNNSGYINGSGNTTGTSGGVQSVGGRETSSPTPQTVVFRDAAGRAQIVTPVAANDIANKSYVDAASSGGFSVGPRVLLSGGLGDVVGTPATLVVNTTYSIVYDRTVTFNEAGILHGFSWDHTFMNFPANPLFSGIYNATMEITTDGQTVAQISAPEFLGLALQLSMGSPGGGQITGIGNPYVHWVPLDLSYKSQLKLRLYTGIPGVPATVTFIAAGTETRNNFTIWRYIKNP